MKETKSFCFLLPTILFKSFMTFMVLIIDNNATCAFKKYKTNPIEKTIIKKYLVYPVILPALLALSSVEGSIVEGSQKNPVDPVKQCKTNPISHVILNPDLSGKDLAVQLRVVRQNDKTNPIRKALFPQITTAKELLDPPALG